MLLPVCRHSEAGRVLTAAGSVGPVTRRLIDGHDMGTITEAEAPGADWREQAMCKGADSAVFFTGRGEATEPAKAVCRTCPVREACLEYALVTNERHGVWGGASERERRRMRSQIRRGAAA